MRLFKHLHLTQSCGECRAVTALDLAPEQVRRFAREQVWGLGTSGSQGSGWELIALPLQQRELGRPSFTLRPALEH